MIILLKSFSNVDESRKELIGKIRHKFNNFNDEYKPREKFGKMTEKLKNSDAFGNIKRGFKDSTVSIGKDIKTLIKDSFRG